VPLAPAAYLTDEEGEALDYSEETECFDCIVGVWQWPAPVCAVPGSALRQWPAHSVLCMLEPFAAWQHWQD
jgi:hypothetical protein